MPTSAYKPMQAGRLRRPITIVQDVLTPTAAGLTKTTNTILTTHASISVKATSALIAALAGQAMPQRIITVTFRYPPSVVISPGMRVIDGTHSYKIHQPADVDERHRIMQLYCLEEPAV